MPLFISRLYVIIDAASPDDASDAMVDTFSKGLMDGGEIVDWCFTRETGGTFTTPVPLAEPHQTIEDFRELDVGVIYAAARITSP